VAAISDPDVCDAAQIVSTVDVDIAEQLIRSGRVPPDLPEHAALTEGIPPWMTPGMLVHASSAMASKLRNLGTGIEVTILRNLAMLIEDDPGYHLTRPLTHPERVALHVAEYEGQDSDQIAYTASESLSLEDQIVFLELREDADTFLVDYDDELAQPFIALLQGTDPPGSGIAAFMVSALGATTYPSFCSIMRTLYDRVHGDAPDEDT
jgi:hypothetical protein